MMKYSVKCPKTHSEFYKLLSVVSETIEIVSGQNYQVFKRVIFRDLNQSTIKKLKFVMIDIRLII